MGDDEEPARPTTDLSAQDLMRKYFEAQFEPLEVPGGPVSTEKENEDESEYVEEDESEDSGPDSEWGGFSDSEDEDNQVEVIEHKDSSVKSDKAADKRARKAFMVSLIVLSQRIHANIVCSERQGSVFHYRRKQTHAQGVQGGQQRWR